VTITEPRPSGRGSGAAGFACRQVSVEFPTADGPRRVLDRVDFEVRQGEIVSILGRSGTGKTTLLRVLLGLQEPTPESTVLFDGRPVDGPPLGAAAVFQNYAASLLPWRTVERNVALGLEGRIARPQLRERVAQALAMVGLAGREKDYPWQLSGGMQQRVQLARALAMRSSALLMDEPFGALDAMTKATLQDELLAVHARAHPTVVFVTHDIDEAVYLSDRVLVLVGSFGTIGHDIRVDLPRPRHQLATKELPEFLRLRRLVYDAIVETHD
jgi:NitT/TauT family transport system ATP-binding protein